MTETLLTIGNGVAARRYRDAYERVQRGGSGECHIIARQSFTAARDALSAQQMAVADLVLLKGRELTDVARQSGRNAADIVELLTTSCDALSKHYATTDTAEGA